MKTRLSTPTFDHKTSDKNRGFIQPPLHHRGGHLTSAGGSSFGLIALVGDIQPKEVTIEKAGQNLHSFNVADQSFHQKEYFL